MSAHSKETARILREQFGHTARDADWLSNNTGMGITPRNDKDARELTLAQEQAIRSLAKAECRS